MQYPVDQLRSSSGKISAMIFKNDLAGVAETLFWSVEVEFEPLEFDGHRERPSLAADWFTLPIRDWRDLVNQTVEGDQDIIEASFYVFEHDLASWTRVTFGKRTGFSFDVDLEINLELLGLDATWNGPGPSVQPATIGVQITLPYRGFHIYEGLLNARTGDRDGALEIASRHVALQSYKDVRINGSRFIFDPLDV